MKHCNGCGLDLDHSEFSSNRSRKDGLQNRCKSCMRSLNASHYASGYKHKQREVNKKVKARNMGLIEEMKNQNPCPCGESDNCCLDFHHLMDKDVEVPSLVSYGTHRLLEEIAKCCLLCASCHRKVHANRPLKFDPSLLQPLDVSVFRR